MGCICSKASKAKHNENNKELKSNNSLKQITVSLRKEETVVGGGSNDATARLISNSNKDSGSAPVSVPEEEKKAVNNEKCTKQVLQRRPTVECRGIGGQVPFRVSGIAGMPNGEKGAQIVAGWPSWLAQVAGEAINGWVPRRAESFEKLDKIGQGTYSSVYRARDLETNKIVALKKVRFANMEPESVRFMAREIIILRRLDHPNVMKLEGLITSRVSGSLYLVFECMDHDLAGLAATPGIKFTEAQIKGYMQQLLLGLEHCHSHGILHRDIKGSNLLIDNNGNLKIGDFGLATFVRQKQPLTSRVVTLWYRPPELLLGSTEYGVAVDLWSTGCILAEFFSGKPIMPGRTEVEQLHKIFKLCGSPSEEYWKKSKLPHATIFKPQQPYKRCVAETYKDFPSSALSLLDVLLAVEPEGRGTASSVLQNEFFTTNPLPCDPSNFPKYQPSKEFDANLRHEEIRGRKAVGHKGREHDSIRRSSRETKDLSARDANGECYASIQKPQGQSNPKSINPKADGSFEPTKALALNVLSHSGLSVHPGTFDSSQNMKGLDALKNASELRSERSYMHHGATEVSRFSNSVSIRGSSRFDCSSVASINFHWPEEHCNSRYNHLDATGASSEKHVWAHHLLDLSKASYKKAGRPSGKESSMGYVYKKNRIHYSGPLMPPGGNLEEMLREHEKRIQNAVRKARLDKVKK